MKDINLTNWAADKQNCLAFKPQCSLGRPSSYAHVIEFLIKFLKSQTCAKFSYQKYPKLAL